MCLDPCRGSGREATGTLSSGLREGVKGVTRSPGQLSKGTVLCPGAQVAREPPLNLASLR